MKKKIKARMKKKGSAAATSQEYGMSADQTGTKKGPQDSSKYAHSGSGEPKDTASHKRTG